MAIGLLVFVVVAALVVWRRSEGVKVARDMRRLADTQRALVSERLTLERDIRRAKSRARVVSEAERRLGLHVATDAQTRLLSDSMLDDVAPVDTVFTDSVATQPGKRS